MKGKLIILCVCLLSLFFCERGGKEDFFDLEGNKITELEFKLRRETGTIVSYFENGNKKALMTLKNGKPYLIEEWYENGKKKRKKVFTKSFSDWKELTYYENGGEKKEKEIKDNKDHGKEIWWYKNGQKESECDYFEGQLHGKWIFWDENGQLKSIMEFKNGHITRETIFKNGKIISDKYPQKN